MRKKKLCKICGKNPRESARGLCRECAERRIQENILSIKNRSGEFYARWIEGMVRAIEREKAKKGD